MEVKGLHGLVRGNADIEASYQGRDRVMRQRAGEQDPPAEVRCGGALPKLLHLRSLSCQHKHGIRFAGRQARERVEQFSDTVPGLHAPREANDQAAIQPIVEHIPGPAARLPVPPAVEARCGGCPRAAEGLGVAAIGYPRRGHAGRDAARVAQQRRRHDMNAVGVSQRRLLPCLGTRVVQPSVTRGLLREQRVDLKGQP